MSRLVGKGAGALGGWAVPYPVANHLGGSACAQLPKPATSTPWGLDTVYVQSPISAQSTSWAVLWIGRKHPCGSSCPPPAG